MGRPRKTVPTVRKELKLPVDLVAQVELQLFSTVEGRVPYDTWNKLVEALLRRALNRIEGQGKLWDD